MKRHNNRGYTFVEVLVASGIIGMAMGGAIRLIAAMQIQEEAARACSVALNLQENAARLWQLGLSTTEVNNIIPVTLDNDDLARSIGTYTNTIPNSVSFGTMSIYSAANSMGDLETLTCDVTLQNPVGGATRTNTLQLYRPTIR